MNTSILLQSRPACPPVRLSIWPPGRRDNAAAIPVELPWQTFTSWLSTPLESADKHAQGFSPLSAIRPGKGGRIHGGPASFFVGEVDDDATPNVLGRALRELAAFDAIVYTSASATPECPRFRVVARCSRELDDSGYRSVACSMGSMVGTPLVDSQRTRLWYRPITGGLMPPIVRVFEGGQAVDVDEAIAAHPPPPPREPLPVPSVAELDAIAIHQRINQAWGALARTGTDSAFVAACLCHDFGVPEDIATHVVVAHGQRCGWTDFDEVADRVEHAYGGYARNPFGAALGVSAGLGRFFDEQAAALGVTR